MYLCRYAALRIIKLQWLRRCTVAEAQAELVFNSGWPSLALLGSVGEWGDEGTNPKDDRHFIATAVNAYMQPQHGGHVIIVT